MSTPTRDTTGLYCYFVSYSHRQGFGGGSYYTDKPITAFEQIVQIGNELAQANRMPRGSVIVLNYQLLTAPTNH